MSLVLANSRFAVSPPLPLRHVTVNVLSSRPIWFYKTFLGVLESVALAASPLSVNTEILLPSSQSPEYDLFFEFSLLFG